jgi:hypothetical protein
MRIFFICLLLITSTASGEEIVLNATPVSRVTSSIESTAREELTISQGNEYRLLITKDGNDYVWSTRENTNLFLVQSGAFSIFVSKSGNGYIEIFDTSYLPEQAGTPSVRFIYKEHIRNSLGNLTYWGTTDSFSP